MEPIKNGVYLARLGSFLSVAEVLETGSKINTKVGMRNSELFLGIEGYGANLCVGVISDASGKILATKRMPFSLSLHTMQRADLVVRMNELLRPLFSDAGFSVYSHPRCRLCLGIAGANGMYDYTEELPNLLRCQLGIPQNDIILCTGDCEIILASHAYGAGSLIMSGMGSRALFVEEHGNFYFHGGWGPLFGDPGSGFAIGTRSLYLIMDEFDCRKEPSILWQEVELHLRSSDHKIAVWHQASAIWSMNRSRFRKLVSTDCRELLFSFAHQVVRECGLWDWRNFCASLAKPLMCAWNKGCPTASRIASEASLALSQAYLLGLKKIQRKSPLEPLVLCGGVFRYNPRFCEEVLKNISGNRELKVIRQTDDEVCRPAIGALLFSLGRSSRHELRLPEIDVVKNLRANSARWDELRV